MVNAPLVSNIHQFAYTRQKQKKTRIISTSICYKRALHNDLIMEHKRTYSEVSLDDYTLSEFPIVINHNDCGKKKILSDSILYEHFLPEEFAIDCYNKLETEVVYVPRKMLTFSIFGKTFSLPRDKAFYGTVAMDGSTPLYRYGGKFYPQVHHWTPTLQMLRGIIEEKTGISCNHVVVNRYVTGKDHIGLHHDKTRDFADNSPVCTISLGGTRHLVMQYAKKNETDVPSTVIPMTNGSLFVLGSEDNKYYKHKIRKTSGKCDQRISLTFRNIATRRTADGKVVEPEIIKD